MAPKRIRIALIGSSLVLGVLLLLMVLGPRMVRRSTETAARPAPAPATASAQGAGAASAAVEGRSELANGLNSPAGDVRADLRIVDQIFAAYRSALHMGNPIGEKLGFEFLPADNPAINSKGELCDRWGTPYFFHQMSGEKMEIRSAGPDRTLWTADDAVLTP